jgi:hypothetical protein
MVTSPTCCPPAAGGAWPDICRASAAVVNMSTVRVYPPPRSKPVGIGLVDELVGKLLDVGADAGLMYAFAGYSSGAHSRAAGARNPKVGLRRLPEEQGIDYESFIHRVGISFGDCPNVNCILGDVDWTNWEDGDGSIVQAGLCSACGTIAVRCGECGDVTALDSGQERCDSCEAVYEVLTDRDGIFEGVRRVS